jgi:ADP-ribose pyrophosphatase YjhB (NUDIX family)
VTSRSPRYRDTSGKALTDYPRPSVAVDTAVLTVSPDHDLSVLLVRRSGTHKHGTWQLPGTFLHPGETLAQAALRALSDKAGISGLAPVQLAVFDDPGRDDRGWVLSVAHLDVVPWARVATVNESPSAPTRVAPLSDAHDLAFDHDLIVDLAVAHLRSEYDASPDPRALLDEPFTLLQLQRLHEAVSGRRLPKDSFRRRMEPQLELTGDVLEGVVGKPARLFRRAPQPA